MGTTGGHKQACAIWLPLHWNPGKGTSHPTVCSLPRRKHLPNAQLFFYCPHTGSRCLTLTTQAITKICILSKFLQSGHDHNWTNDRGADVETTSVKVKYRLPERKGKSSRDSTWTDCNSLEWYVSDIVVSSNQTSYMGIIQPGKLLCLNST